MSNLSCAEATCLWLTENFADCHATLQKIESETKADNKLAHNLLVVEHVLAGRTDSERIASLLEILANDRIPFDDAATADIIATSSRGRSSGLVDALPLVPVRDDLAVAQLNRAILLYQCHCCTAAAELLEPLAANAEALAEGTAVRVLTLLLDIYIEGRQLPRAVAILHALERLYSTLTEAYGSTDRPPTAFASGSPGAAGAGADGGAGGGDSGPGGAAGRAVAVHAQGSSGGGGDVAPPCCGWRPPRSLELPRVSRWGSGAMVRSRELLEQQGRPPAVPDLKLLIRLYRSRLHALAHNTRAAKRELQAVVAALGGSVMAAAAATAPTGAGGEPGGGDGGAAAAAGPEGQARAGSPAAGSLLVAVRAQLELYRGRVRKATKLLVALMQDPTFADAHRPLLLNNLALVHHQLGKHTLALLYLSQALAAASPPTAAYDTTAAPSAGGPSLRGTAAGSASGFGRQQQQQQQQREAAPQATGLGGRGAVEASGDGSSSSGGLRAGEGAAAAAPPNGSGVPVPAVMYNAGLQHLLLGNFQAARGCFTAAASQYSNTPLLWLRTAEAALGLYHRSQHAPQSTGQEQQQPSATTPSSSHPLNKGAQFNLPNHIAATAVNGPVGSGPAGRQDGTGAVTLRGVREVLPCASDRASSGGDVSSAVLLSEAITALQTALQQLDAQQDEHEQWQSSSYKLDEGGGALPAMPPTAPQAAVGTNDGSPRGVDVAGGRAQAAGPSPLSPPASAPPAEPDMPPPPAMSLDEQQQTRVQNHDRLALHQQQQQQAGTEPHQPGHAQRPLGGAAPGSEGSSGGIPQAALAAGLGAAGGLALPMENGMHEHHGTDASAALAEELRAVRLAVLANLSYAHLQAGDWASALAAARALMDAAAAVPPAATAGAVSSDALAPAAVVDAAATTPPAPQAPYGGSAPGESYSFLAASYMAEALCHLDRPGDAVECLSLWLAARQEREAAAAATAAAVTPAGRGQQGHQATPGREVDNNNDNNGNGNAWCPNGGGGGAAATAGGAAGPGARDEVHPLGNAAALAALTGPAALAATYTNLASVFASQGELPQAAGLVRQALALQPASGAAALLLVYCELAAGNTGAALALLKHGAVQGQGHVKA